MLVTLSVERSVPSLRWKRTHAAIRHSICRANRAGRVGIVEYSVQRDHIHLLVEAREETSFVRGMQGLATRIAKAVNRVLQRRGRVFRDRFHSKVLRFPRQVRNALAYVLGNARKHGLARGVSRDWVDPCSSATRFNGWSRRIRVRGDPPAPTVGARTWLLRAGWKRWGLLDPAFVPG